MKRRLLPFSGGGDNGYDIRTVCRNRCRQKDRCWMSDYGPRPESADGSNSHVRNSGDATGSASRLAEASGLHSCRDGEYWVVLEADFHRDCSYHDGSTGQYSTPEERSRTEDRREALAMAC